MHSMRHIAFIDSSNREVAMKTKIHLILPGIVLLLASEVGITAGSALPGDHGRPGNGLPNASPPARAPGSTPPPPRAPQVAARAPSVELAYKAAQAIAEGCKQFRLAVAVVNAEGGPTLIYVPDGTEASHGFTAMRKAYSAITFKVPTSQLVGRAQQDTEFAEKVKADTNLMPYSGGLLLKVGEEIIGAIGVSGAEPGAHDEECGLIGLEKIKSQLK
jgi:uncharacterized protein GlcG (DUF336 family)